MSDILPTRDGDGVQRAALLAGDAAGFVDSTGSSISDNAIGSPDINAINVSIFLRASDTGYNTFSDINQDSIVNATDKDFATANTTDNTGAAGNIRPVFPAFNQGLLQGSNEEARITPGGLTQGGRASGRILRCDLTGFRGSSCYGPTRYICPTTRQSLRCSRLYRTALC